MTARTTLDRYEAALREHLHGPSEEHTLLQAYEVGRELMQRGFGLLDVVRLHTDAAADIQTPDDADSAGQRQAGAFLAEVLAPFEMAYLGYEEANNALRGLTSSLEQQVDQRTRELRDSLSALQAADADRRRLLERVVSAQEQERHRIADDLHDDTIQVLTAAALRLSTLTARVDPDDQPRLARLEETISDAIGRLRRMTFELRPPALDSEGLAAAIRTHLHVGADELEHTVTDHLDTQPPIQVREIAYRITQEAIANVRKHARAHRVDVTVASHRDGVHVTVADDGTGFDPAELDSPVPGHLGVAAMRERAALAAGWCTIDSTPHHGTTVTIWLPHHDAAIT